MSVVCSYIKLHNLLSCSLHRSFVLSLLRTSYWIPVFFAFSLCVACDCCYFPQLDYYADLRQLRAKVQHQWSQDLAQLDQLASSSSSLGTATPNGPSGATSGAVNWNQENAGALSSNSSSLSSSSSSSSSQVRQFLPPQEALVLSDVLTETSTELDSTRESMAHLKGRLAALRGSPFSPTVSDASLANEGSNSKRGTGLLTSGDEKGLQSPPSMIRQQQSPRYSSSGYLAASSSPAGISSARVSYGSSSARSEPAALSNNADGLSDMSSLSNAMDVIMSIDVASPTPPRRRRHY